MVIKMKDKILSNMENNKKWYVLVICLIGFIIILLNVLNGNIQKFDEVVYNAVISIKSDFVTNIIKVITEFGDALVLITIVILCFCILKNKKIAGSIAINLVLFPLLNTLLKNIIKRPRPEGYRLIQETGYSFPSGHSMAAMAFYGLIIYYIFENVKNIKIRNISCILLSILILLIGISRIYLGVHYASDVLAGFLVSLVYLIVYISIILKITKQIIDKKKKE